MGFSRKQAAQIGLVGFTMVGTLLLSAFGRAAAPFATVGLGALLLLRFGDIASLTFKAFGAEAIIQRAERAAEDATKAIEALKQTGMHLSSMVLTLQTLLGQGGTVTIAGVLTSRRTVLSDLEALGCTRNEVAEVMRLPDHITLMQMVTTASNAMRVDHMALMKEKLTSVLEHEPIDMPAVRAVFREYEVTQKAERWLSQAEQFQKTGEVDLEKLAPF
jgi:hypothetical protein